MEKYADWLKKQNASSAQKIPTGKPVGQEEYERVIRELDQLRANDKFPPAK